MWDVTSRPEIELMPPAWQHGVMFCGLPGKSWFELSNACLMLHLWFFTVQVYCLVLQMRGEAIPQSAWEQVWLSSVFCPLFCLDWCQVDKPALSLLCLHFCSFRILKMKWSVLWYFFPPEIIFWKTYVRMANVSFRGWFGLNLSSSKPAPDTWNTDSSIPCLSFHVSA